MSTTAQTAADRLAELPAHEAVAVYAKMYEELLFDVQRLAERVEQFEAMQHGFAYALRKSREHAAGQLFFNDTSEEARAYLAELVDRVKGEDDA